MSTLLPLDFLRPVQQVVKKQLGGSMKIWLAVLLAIWGLGIIYGRRQRPPSGDAAGYAMKGPWRPATALEFFCDLTYERDGKPVHEQQILTAMLAEIARAERFVIIDLFLFNDLGGREVVGEELASPVARLTEALVTARLKRPELAVLFINDEINTGYGSYPEPHLERLAAHGIEVVMVDLSRLPDSNPLYSGLWRPWLQWLKPDGRGRLPNIFAPGAPRMNLASYLRLFNFKANHRKMLITERAGLISSGNIHDASVRHSNIAFLVKGPIVADLVAGELAVARFSGHDFVLPGEAGAGVAAGPCDRLIQGDPCDRLPAVRWLTENAIRRALLRGLAATRAGDRIWVAQFYLAERRLVAALVAAARRGVEVRLILDPNRDAFGYDKYGIPNRSTAARLKARAGDNLEVRWYNTRGEQFHAKLTMIEFATPAEGGGLKGETRIIGGSANFTRRNLGGFNLESCLEIRGAAADPAVTAVRDFFHRLWHNRDGLYLVDYEHYAEDRPLKAALAAWQEFSGMGTF